MGMKPKPLSVALLGTGRISETQLAPALASASGLRLWSVLSRDRGRAADFARRHRARSREPGYDRLDEMLADPGLDAVLIATPDALHADQALAAIAAGKHVFVEKPMVTSSADGRRVLEAAEAAGVTVGVAYHLRWHGGHRAMERLISGGALGALRHMRVQWTWPAPDDSNWRAGSDVGRWWSLAGVGTHCLDMIRWFMVPGCGEVVEVRAVTSNAVWGGPRDETALVALTFESGATAEFCSSVQFESPSRVEVYGDQGYVIGNHTLGPRGAGTVFTRAGMVPYVVQNPYVGELADFAAAVRNGRPPAVDAREGLRNVELLEEIK